MTLADLTEWITIIGTGGRLPDPVKKRIGAELPSFFQALEPASVPGKIRLPTGESLTNATRMTALKCHCLLLARTAFGANFTKVEAEYDRQAKDLLFWAMRFHFKTNEPKGVYCCAVCSLSILPLYAFGCFRWVDCEELKARVLDALDNRKSVFRGKYPDAYAEWIRRLAR